ncbi:MAG: hypothetical protein HZA13_06320 [Nitrospirae bacterium]|nr:hypothetical protein [Nitrospirota bacterium]
MTDKEALFTYRLKQAEESGWRKLRNFMLSELEVLKTITTRLDSAGIPYMVSGSIAANFYTTPRMTRDIDIVIELRKEDADTLISLFSDDFYIDIESVKVAIRDKEMFNIIHNEAVIKVDFIVRKETAYRKIEFERRRSIIFEGLRIYITSPEDLIISKLYWAKDSFSEIQIMDVENLINTLPGLDKRKIKDIFRSGCNS